MPAVVVLVPLLVDVHLRLCLFADAAPKRADGRVLRLGTAAVVVVVVAVRIS